MSNETTRFVITRHFFEKTGPKLNALFERFVPDERFRFFTFEGDDYAENKLTLLLYTYQPEVVFVTVPYGYNVDDAVNEVIGLNAHLRIEPFELNYLSAQDMRLKRQTQAFQIFPKTFQVDSSGKLII